MRRLVTVLWALVCLALLGVLAWLPVHLGQQIGFAQFFAMPAPWLAALAVMGLLLLVTSLLRRRVRMLTLTCVVVVALASVPWLSPRLTTPPRAFDAADLPEASADGLRVLSWNVGGSADSIDDVATLARQVSPQIIALPETTPSEAHALADQLAASGLDMRVVPAQGSDSSWPSSVLISSALGRYRVVDDTSQSVRPGVATKPVNGQGPTIVVAHAQQPGLAAEQAQTWRAHLRWLGSWCDSGEAIVVGDFNGTDANIGSTLGSCRAPDSTTQGSTTGGTWPSALPAWLGAPIDRAYTTAQWQVSGLWPIAGQRVSASDHRPIVVDLSRSATPAG
ncbi:endonuclease/exonuclease/phosphatase family protein [Pseudoclavibacter sp. 13-3]|uniref:endonuclease/exonuclease/phosphatase family protein n=1 Tax=Pseudoclavibacter sp. 13-3 TaxID=2901228 RepID=UPI001E40250E|nr:endonuclease/exonuclease/phosphatase family protein [Pseudoclavibacter sp. 13-3]MCD7101815.1 endonuclease/exonuclease/phosphatase family protein [Pseudoclavibacter sp. 13-3]